MQAKTKSNSSCSLWKASVGKQVESTTRSEAVGAHLTQEIADKPLGVAARIHEAADQVQLESTVRVAERNFLYPRYERSNAALLVRAVHVCQTRGTRSWSTKSKCYLYDSKQKHVHSPVCRRITTMQVLKSSAPKMVRFSAKQKTLKTFSALLKRVINTERERWKGMNKKKVKNNKKKKKKEKQEVAHVLLTIVRKSDGEFSLVQIQQTDGRHDFGRKRRHVSRRLFQMRRRVEQIARIDRRLVQHHSADDQHHPVNEITTQQSNYTNSTQRRGAAFLNHTCKLINYLKNVSKTAKWFSNKIFHLTG